MNFSNIEETIQKPTGGPPENIEKILFLRDQIETFEKIHQIEILRILYNNGALLNFNKNGTLINMLEIDPLILIQLQKYVDYVLQQEQNLSQNEIAKESIKKMYFPETCSNSQSNLFLYS